MVQCKIQKKGFVKIMLISKNIFNATYALQEFLNYITMDTQLANANHIIKRIPTFLFQ